MLATKCFKFLSACAVFILLGIGVTSSAQAGIIIFDFTATIGSMFGYDGSNQSFINFTSSTMPGALVSNGDIIHGHFYYDEAMPLGIYQVPQVQGSYQIYYGLGGIDFSTGSSGLQFVSGTNPSVLQIANNASTFGGTDLFYLSADKNYSPITYQGADILLSDSSGTVFDSSAIPSALPFNHFGFAMLEYAWLLQSNGDQYHFTARIDSVTPAAVPEPATYTMLLAGLGLMAFGRRRKGVAA